jgi:hypothetical protein
MMIAAPGLVPFRYEEPLEPDELVDREDELAAVHGRVSAGRNTRVTAPRRYGKTSLLRRLLRDCELEGVVGVYVDFYGVLTLADVSARIEAAYEQALRGPLARWFQGVRRTLQPIGRVSAGPASVQLGAGAGPTPVSPQTALLERLAMPKRLAERTGRTVAVVFDEFQAVLTAGEQTDAVFRSEIQHHGDRVAYVFAGSHPGMMRQLFAERSRPFFDQAAPLTLGPLPDAAAAAHIGDVFERTGRSCDEVLGALLALGEGHPQRVMQLAAHLWAHTAVGTAADHETWQRTVESVGAETTDAFRQHWDGLPASYRRALSAIAAADAPLLSKTAQSAHGTRPGTTNKAVASLREAGDIEVDQHSATGWKVIDPLWRAWIAAGRANGL